MFMGDTLTPGSIFQRDRLGSSGIWVDVWFHVTVINHVVVSTPGYYHFYLFFHGCKNLI